MPELNMNARFFPNSTPSIATTYDFLNKEQSYFLFRPKWPKEFALAALQQAGIELHENTGLWSGIDNKLIAPAVICIGSGSGSDPEALLNAGCIVYAVEPNAELRALAENRLKAKFPHHFFSIEGNAHNLNLPENLIADVIVCAQALHTFAAEINGATASEALARERWQKHLPDDNRNRLSIWYYNLDARNKKILSLHALLRSMCLSYQKSKTPLVDAEMFEPSKFQHFINAADMHISTAQPVDRKNLNYADFIQWLESYSFFPNTAAEKNVLMSALSTWFAENKNRDDKINIDYIGFISQGPLRKTPYFGEAKHFMLEKSPISTNGICTHHFDLPFWLNKKPQIQFRAIL